MPKIKPDWGACGYCWHREGKLVEERLIRRFTGPMGEIRRNVVWRTYLCQWCFSAYNRRARRKGRPELAYIERTPDRAVRAAARAERRALRAAAAVLKGGSDAAP